MTPFDPSAQDWWSTRDWWAVAAAAMPLILALLPEPVSRQISRSKKSMNPTVARKQASVIKDAIVKVAAVGTAAGLFFAWGGVTSGWLRWGGALAIEVLFILAVLVPVMRAKLGDLSAEIPRETASSRYERMLANRSWTEADFYDAVIVLFNLPVLLANLLS